MEGEKSILNLITCGKWNPLTSTRSKVLLPVRQHFYACEGYGKGLAGRRPGNKGSFSQTFFFHGSQRVDTLVLTALYLTCIRSSFAVLIAW